jgi:hypothetical protein
VVAAVVEVAAETAAVHSNHLWGMIKVIPRKARLFWACNGVNTMSIVWYMTLICIVVAYLMMSFLPI